MLFSVNNLTPLHYHTNHPLVRLVGVIFFNNISPLHYHTNHPLVRLVGIFLITYNLFIVILIILRSDLLVIFFLITYHLFIIILIIHWLGLLVLFSFSNLSPHFQSTFPLTELQPNHNLPHATSHSLECPTSASTSLP